MSFDIDLQSIAEAQGWTEEDLGALALGFITNTLGTHYQEVFLAFVRQCAHTDNDPLLDFDGVESQEVTEDQRDAYDRYQVWISSQVPEIIVSRPVVEEDDLNVLASRIRDLGAAVTVVPESRLEMESGVLDAGEIEDAMQTAAEERLDFIASSEQ